MPLVKIDLYKGKSSEYKKAILTAVHDALVEAFKIPQEDRTQIIQEWDEENFERMAGRTKNFTLIEITAFKGRSREAKKQLFSKITEKLKLNPGIDPSDVIITINEPALENWGINGTIADEINFGFKIEV